MQEDAVGFEPRQNILRCAEGVPIGYVVSDKGREPDPDKIVIIDELATPTNAKGIVKLLGHVGWYKELIPDFAKIAIPITQVLRKDCRFEWSEDCQRAFEELRLKLSTYLVLRPPDWDKPFHVFYDASNVAVGSALCQST